ncbi:MAG: hypothetical protein ACE5F1_04960, partial [Planctomycetota bacterium]
EGAKHPVQVHGMDRRSISWIAGLTVLVEAVTCLGRFVFDVQATRDTGWLAGVTFGLRVHHGYLGILLLLLCPLVRRASASRVACLRLGSALLLSDLLHHFVVLWLIQGDPEFHLRY